MWHQTLLLVLLVLLVLCTTGSASVESSLKGAAREGTGGVIKLSGSQLRELLQNGPRELSVIVLFSTEPECEPCKMTRNLLQMSAEKFRARHGKDNNFIFALVGLNVQGNEDRTLATELGLEYVPMMYHFKPKRSGGRIGRISKKDREAFPPEARPDLQSVMRYIQDQTNLRMPTVKNHQVMFASLILNNRYNIIAALVIMAIISVILGIHRRPNFWLGIVLCVMCFSLSGGHYTLIHNSPLFVWKDGIAVLIAAGSMRSQYFTEGLGWSILVMSASAIMLGLKTLPKSHIGTTKLTLLSLFLLGSLVCCFFFATTMFLLKTPGYLQWVNA